MSTLLAFHGSGRDETDLVEFCRQLAPAASLLAPRGLFVQEDGFTFFKRRPDRSIAAGEVVNLATEWIGQEIDWPIFKSGDLIAIGYSSGAIFVEALLAIAPKMFAGAILLRPEPLSPDFEFPRMLGKPVFIVAGERDERRHPDDAAVLARQLHKAGADISLHIIDAGHGWAGDDGDLALARSWLATLNAS